MNDEKYIVFKRKDFDQLREKLISVELPTIVDRVLDLPPVEDAVVIRKQDVFAGPALHAYASSIQTVIELLRSLSTDPVNVDHGVPGLTVEQMSRLYPIRDYFFQQAFEADDVRTKKVPD